MKKFLIIFVLFLFCSNSVSAETEIYDTAGISMQNFWERTGKYEQKVVGVGTNLVNANKLDKRVVYVMNKSNKIINASTSQSNKVVTVYYGLVPYMDNDDELAFILGHETGHALDDYGGFLKWMDMYFNSKEYETKADLIGIDLMVKAGYNPVAAICVMNKIGDESYWDVPLLTSHPKTSKRLLAMYKYIYVKYPWALKSDMIHNVNYENFTYSSEKEINEFKQHEKERSEIQHREDL